MLKELSTTCVNVSISEEVVYVTLNRPRAMNALSSDLTSELTAVFQRLNADFKKGAAERVVILRGAEGNFCVGGDVKEMSELVKRSHDDDLDFIASYNEKAGWLFSAVAQSAIPVIAVVEGAALGGGLGLACAADITIARKDAIFGLPETSLGLVPAQVAPVIRRRVGESNARLMAILGGKFDAERAERLGLVHFIAASEVEMEALIGDLIRQIKLCAPKAVNCAKELMTESSPLAKASPAKLGMLFARHMASDEGKEGTSAFVEKGKPSWCR